jgi:cell division protein FtsW (lipid II flippase)
LSLQAFFNLGVNTAVIPSVGIAVPFVSYGGSQLMASLAAVGIVLSIAYHSTNKKDFSETFVGRTLVLQRKVG